MYALLMHSSSMSVTKFFQGTVRVIDYVIFMQVVLLFLVGNGDVAVHGVERVRL